MYIYIYIHKHSKEINGLSWFLFTSLLPSPLGYYKPRSHDILTEWGFGLDVELRPSIIWLLLLVFSSFWWLLFDNPIAYLAQVCRPRMSLSVSIGRGRDIPTTPLSLRQIFTSTTCWHSYKLAVNIQSSIDNLEHYTLARVHQNLRPVSKRQNIPAQMLSVTLSTVAWTYTVKVRILR